ncbi:Acetyltransferase (GNAT) family protein [Deinococcus reticulitermitis]|uniref:Acetyltransferase (GNAT) family protein n=1 Tax=Deinococcus reticulitermitis TaxID=856736 RepID=A0A1H6ZW95_9DEIO|nr:GNAT family N-acetyltransferase [Deinococcus reticulitermitis]SEJ57729.1 Acetyltransferase (GNAT) family protein [Deinococcus reticulitermitis]
MNRTLSFTPLTLISAPLLHGLYQDTPGYFQLLGGHVPTLGEVERDIETAHHDRRRHLELLHDPQGRLVGSVDYKTDYPDPGDLTINLLLIREDQQGRGWGKVAARQLERRYAPSKRRVLASVLGDNPRGAHFWERLGYRFALDARPAMTWYAKELTPPASRRTNLLAGA